MNNKITKVSKIMGMAAALAAVSMAFTGCASIEGTATITPDGATKGTVVNYSAEVKQEGEQADVQAQSSEVQKEAAADNSSKAETAKVTQAAEKAPEKETENTKPDTQNNSAQAANSNDTKPNTSAQATNNNNKQNTSAQATNTDNKQNTPAQAANTANTQSTAPAKAETQTSSKAENKTADTKSDSSAYETTFIGCELLDLSCYDPITLAGFRIDDLTMNSNYHITDHVYGTQAIEYGVAFDEAPNIVLAVKPIDNHDGAPRNGLEMQAKYTDENYSYIPGNQAVMVNCFNDQFIGLSDITGKEVYATMSYNELKDAIGGELPLCYYNDTLGYYVGGYIDGRYWKFGLDLSDSQVKTIEQRLSDMGVDPFDNESDIDLSDMNPDSFVAACRLGVSGEEYGVPFGE